MHASWRITHTSQAWRSQTLAANTMFQRMQAQQADYPLPARDLSPSSRLTSSLRRLRKPLRRSHLIPSGLPICPMSPSSKSNSSRKTDLKAVQATSATIRLTSFLSRSWNLSSGSTKTVSFKKSEHKKNQSN